MGDGIAHSKGNRELGPMKGRTPISLLLCLLLSGVAYAALLYGTVRPQYGQLWLCFGLLFGAYAYLLWQLGLLGGRPPAPATGGFMAWLLRPQGLILTGIGFRLLALLAFPELSDDYFRFVWDGLITTHGGHPYRWTPETWLAQPEAMAAHGLTPALFEGLNSKTYFSIYPPILQVIFYVSVKLAPPVASLYAPVVLMKTSIFLGELLALWLLPRLLRYRHLPATALAFYAWNPLIVIELTGNLHFEGLMICFLLLALYALDRQHVLAAAGAFALAVGVKLLPLMLLPLMLRRLGWGRAIGFGLLVMAGSALLLAPVFGYLDNFLQGLDLYFRRFEFNASIYYLVREAGYELTGYNVIRKVGPWLGGITFTAIMAYSFVERRPDPANLPRGMMWVFTIYLAMATIVHPWYMCVLIPLGALTRYRFMLVWSALIPLSYFTYRDRSYTEHLGLVALEYVVVLAVLLYEVRGGRRKVR